MSKFSKQLNGRNVAASDVNVSASPVSDPSKIFPTIVSAKDNKTIEILTNQIQNQEKSSSNTSTSKSSFVSIASNIQKINSKKQIIGSTNLEETSDNQTNVKIFKLNTGLSPDEPTIILSTNFIPLYEGGNENTQNNAIQLKEASKLINSKASIVLLSQNQEVIDTIKQNQLDLKSYIQNQSSFITSLLRIVSKTINSFSLTSYNLPNYGNFTSILLNGGYSSNNILKFSSTKIWQQSLIELKRSLLANSSQIISKNYTRKDIRNDEDAFLLSDVEEPSSSEIKFWINPYTSLPNPEDFSKETDVAVNSNKLISFAQNQYINLASANLTTLPVFSNDIIKPYDLSGLDIAIVSNILEKEFVYSKFLSNQENVKMLNETFGFSFDPENESFNVWDYLIGRFSKSSLVVSKNPTGNGNSLSSFSQESITENNNEYDVLTFETLSKESITPGVFYYIDSSLSTKDGKTFDIQRLDKLITKTKKSNDTLKTILDLMGYDIVRDQSNETYKKKEVFDSLDLTQLTKKTSLVTSTYKKVFKQNQINQIEEIDPNLIKNLTQTEANGIRLASLICKSSVYPTAAYSKNSLKIKTLLFMWLLNLVVKQVEGINTDSANAKIKKSIIENLISVKEEIDTYGLQQAAHDGRIISVSTGSDSSVIKQSKSSLYDYESNQINSSHLEATIEKIFETDFSKGIWKILFDLLKSVYQKESLYTKDGKLTSYSSLSKVAFLFSYFDLLLRLVASQTPENLKGFYESKNEIFNLSKIASSITQTGFLIDKPSKNQINEFFSIQNFSLNRSSNLLVKKIEKSIQVRNIEEKNNLDHIKIFKEFTFQIGKNANYMKNFLQKNFQNYLLESQALYAKNINLSDQQKIDLLNMSLSEEQLILSKFIMSEYKDRIDSSSDSVLKLKAFPHYADCADNFNLFLDSNEISAISYGILSTFFKSIEFLKEKGNNKKIISIGIPQKLNQILRSSFDYSSNNKRTKDNIVRVKIYKKDILHPDVVYLPKSYLFEMTRFPTRIASNWDFESLLNDTSNILRIPQKLYLSNHDFLKQKDFSEAFPQSIYGSESTGILNQSERLEVYSNHSISFIIEEYLRWFTSCEFNETLYHNFSQIQQEIEEVNSQKVKFTNSLIRQKDSLTSQKIQTKYNDPVSGKSFIIPVKNENLSKQENLNKSYLLTMDSTFDEFFRNETFLLDVDYFKQRITYPKKFDRVFNVLIDPDDFEVDLSTSSTTTLDSLASSGVLIKESQTNNQQKIKYRHRDTTPDDVTYDEYFITVEPYDYVQEYES